MHADENCFGLVSSGLGLKTSPFFAMMGVATTPHPPWFRKNGDESSTEAAEAAAPANVHGVRASVSHPTGLEASPTGRASRPPLRAVGPPAVVDHRADHDLVRRRLTAREIRGRSRLL